MGYFSSFTTNPNSISSDLSGHLKNAERLSIANYKSLNYDNSYLMNSVGTGTDTLSNNIQTMAVTSGQYRIRQSRLFHPYYPGNTQLIEMTCRNLQLQSGIIKRLGYFSSSTSAPYDSTLDGFFFESNGDTGVYSLNIYNNGSLIVSIPSTSFDRKELLTGYNFANFSIFAFDFLWLGGFGLRFFMAIDGQLQLIHTYKHAGNYSSLIFQSPNRPLRYEIRSTTGAGSFDTICSTVSSSGVTNPLDGYYYDIETPFDGVKMSSSGSTYPIILLRRKTTNRSNAVELMKFRAYTRSNTNLNSRIVINPTISGTPTWIDQTNSSLQYALGNGSSITATGGVSVDSSMSYQRDQTESDSSKMLKRFLQNVDGTSDVIALVCRGDANNTNVYASLEIREI